MDFSLTQKEKAILLTAARESIRSVFTGKADYPEPDEVLMTPLGAFVTLHIDSNLKGCIGHILPVRELFEDIKYLARESAFRDPRFKPLTEEEFASIDIEISVLSPLTEGTADEVVTGKHGIIMSRGLRSGVLLPQVPVEQGWNREEFLTHTCYKAGMDGDCWKDPETRIQLFTAVVFGEKDQLD